MYFILGGPYLFQAQQVVTIVTSLFKIYVWDWIYHASKLIMSKLSLYNLGVAILVSIGIMASLPSPHSKQIRSHALSVLLLRDFIIFRITALHQLPCVFSWYWMFAYWDIWFWDEFYSHLPNIHAKKVISLSKNRLALQMLSNSFSLIWHSNPFLKSGTTPLTLL